MNKDVLPDDVIALKEMIILLQEENERLKEQAKLFLSHRFGRKSEKIHPGQLELQLFDEPCIVDAEVDLAASDEELTITYKRKKSGRPALPKNLPRETITHDLSDAEKVCACGHELHCIGEEKSEQIDFVPAKIKVVEHVRPKYSCRACQEGVKIAPMPKLPIPKSIAAPGFLANLLVSKYQDHLPFYRQEQIWQRIGLDIPRATLSYMTLKAATFLSPLVDLLQNDIIASDYAKADETPVTVLEREGKRGSFGGYMWVFTSGLTEKRAVVFKYHPTREGKVAEEFFTNFKGYLQTDGYSGYLRFRAAKKIKSLGCMQHCRRKFVDVIKISQKKKSGAAYMAVQFIQKLYQLEEKAKQNNLSFEEITQLRQDESVPIMNEFHTWLINIQPKVPPKSKLGEAINYALNQWETLVVYLSDGRLDIDNNSTERMIKPFALGRKNWLFSGNEKGARASAIIYSLLETAKANNLEPYAYFRYVLTHLPYAQTDDERKMLLPQYCEKNKIDALP
jgi:transposase